MEKNPKEVKRRTGFGSLEEMLAYVCVVCNGDCDEIIATNSKLTWLEEWFIYFEIVWGHRIQRWMDASTDYNTNERTVKNIFDSKLVKVNECRNLWPTYATYEEDHALTKQKWRDKFKGKRIVMRDDTNINLKYQPSAMGNVSSGALAFAVHATAKTCARHCCILN